MFPISMVVCAGGHSGERRQAALHYNRVKEDSHCQLAYKNTI